MAALSYGGPSPETTCCHRHRAVITTQEHCDQPVSAYNRAEVRVVVTGWPRGGNSLTGWSSVSRGYYYYLIRVRQQK